MVEMVLNNLVLAFWRLYRHKSYKRARCLNRHAMLLTTTPRYARLVCVWRNGRTERQAKESSVCNVKYKLFVSSLNCYPLGCASTSQSFLNQDLYYIILT